MNPVVAWVRPIILHHFGLATLLLHIVSRRVVRYMQSNAIRDNKKGTLLNYKTKHLQEKAQKRAHQGTGRVNRCPAP